MTQTENNQLNSQTVPLVFSSCNLYRRSVYFEEQCCQFREKKSQKLNSIDNGRVGEIPNHGNALNYISIVIPVIGCILAALL